MGSSVVTPEDVLESLMNDGTIDAIRLKIINQLKANVSASTSSSTLFAKKIVHKYIMVSLSHSLCLVWWPEIQLVPKLIIYFRRKWRTDECWFLQL